jgi:hypothetical protein
MRTAYVVSACLLVGSGACSDDHILTPDSGGTETEDGTTETTDDPVGEGGGGDGVGGDWGSATPGEACLAGDTTTLTASEGATLELEAAGDIVFRLDVPADASETDGEIGLQCLNSGIVPEGYIAMGPAIEITLPDLLIRYASVTLPFDATLMPENARPSALRIFYSPPGTDRSLSPPAVNLQENMTRGFTTFGTRFEGSFQMAISDDAGEAYDRDWVFRAITGVSMGCSGTAMIALRHPSAFDIIGALGGPTDWTYLAHYIHDGGLGQTPSVPTEEFEHAQSFDNWWFPTGEGTGGTFDRKEYIHIFQDLALTFGNLGSYNDQSPYLPAGLDPSELERSWGDRCPGGDGTTTIEEGFYDDEYNPDGDLPVIMFCDGLSNQDRTLEFDRYCYLDENEQPDEANEGLYPGGENQREPVVIGWAVDENGNGIRDFGEPVIRNYYEPFDDVGVDGLPDADEDGYDADTHPDPSDDNYDYWTNPTGTEGNWLYDEGEPWDDFGLDGVEDTAQLDDGGYDYGEGNREFDYNPNLEVLLMERDPHHNAYEMSREDWDNLTIYTDAGVRDLFNFEVSTNQFVGAVAANGENVRIYDGFFSLANLDPEEDSYRFAEVNYGEVGDHVYLRYGSLDASAEDICFGDGKHVGTVPQIANRLLTLLGFVTSRFPEGDTTTLTPPYPTPSGDYRFYSEALGAWEQYSIILPPGHEWYACNDSNDNDEDGLQDGDDPDCMHGMDNSEGPGLGDPLCSDGIDNDADGLMDFPEDDGCTSADDTSEWPADHPLRLSNFPVVYLLHGYGQTPDELRATVVPFAAFMAGGIWQKVIVVYPDGFCGDNDINQCNDGIDNDDDDLIDSDDPGCADSGGRGEDGVAYMFCNDGVDNDGDGLIDDDDGGCIFPEADDESECVKGTFYSDHAAFPDGSSPGPAFEAAMFDLMDHIDDIYRTREPETIEAYR